jgi:hypothetical protein
LNRFFKISFLLKAALFIGAVFFVYACSFEEEDNRRIAAQIHDQKLYLQDVIENTPRGLSPEDSSAFADAYVNSWIKERLVLLKAKEILPDSMLNIEEQIESYRRSLIVFQYERAYINSNLDTNVSEQEIIRYYNTHKDDFILNDYIIKVLYIKLYKSDNRIDKVAKHYKLQNDGDYEKLDNIIAGNAENFYYDPENWLFFDDLLKEVLLQDFNRQSFIQNKRKVSFEEGEFIYFLNILDYKLKDAYSPLSLEREKIKNIILNNRSNELRVKLREDLFNDAQKENSIKRYK